MEVVLEVDRCRFETPQGYDFFLSFYLLNLFDTAVQSAKALMFPFIPVLV